MRPVSIAMLFVLAAISVRAADSSPAIATAINTNESLPGGATGKEIDLAELARNRQEWPREVTLTEKVAFPILIDGLEKGSMELSPGRKVQLVEVLGEQVKVSFNETTKVIPTKATDLVSKVLATREEGAKREASARSRAKREAAAESGAKQSMATEFKYHIAQYTETANFKRWDKARPYVRGKVVAISKEEGQSTWSLDTDMRNGLPRGWRADRPEEVETVLLLERSSEKVGEYHPVGGLSLSPLSRGGAYRRVCKVTIIDWLHREIVCKKTFTGGFPPRYTRSSSDYGGWPDNEIINFLEALPRYDPSNEERKSMFAPTR